MAVVQMYVQKFGKVVTIDDEHPLAIAERARQAADVTESPDVADDTPSARGRRSASRRAGA